MSTLNAICVSMLAKNTALPDPCPLLLGRPGCKYSELGSMLLSQCCALSSSNAIPSRRFLHTIVVAAVVAVVCKVPVVLFKIGTLKVYWTESGHPKCPGPKVAAVIGLSHARRDLEG